MNFPKLLAAITIFIVAILIVFSSCLTLTSTSTRSFIVVTSNSWDFENLPEDCFVFTTDEELQVLVVNCDGVVVLWLYRDTVLEEKKVFKADSKEISSWELGNLDAGAYRIRASLYENGTLMSLENFAYPFTITPP